MFLDKQGGSGENSRRRGGVLSRVIAGQEIPR